MASDNLPDLSGSDGSEDPGSTGNRWEPVSGGRDELTAVMSDSRTRRRARRLAAGLAEDLIQETGYIVARVSARRPIDNVAAYFSQVMVNTAKRMREDIARQGIPVDDPIAAAGPRRGRELAAASAEDDALLRLLCAGRRELLRRRRTELRQDIPACSPDPSRYRDVILDVVGAMLADDGPASRPEINAALIAAYPGWFAAPDVAAATIYQRRKRGREDVSHVLWAVIGP